MLVFFFCCNIRCPLIRQFHVPFCTLKISRYLRNTNTAIAYSVAAMICSQNFLHDSEIEKLFTQSCRLYLITEKKHTFNYRLMRKQTLVIAATTPCIIPSQFLVWKCIFVLNKGNGWSTYLLQPNIVNKLKQTLQKHIQLLQWIKY